MPSCSKSTFSFKSLLSIRDHKPLKCLLHFMNYIDEKKRFLFQHCAASAVYYVIIKTGYGSGDKVRVSISVRIIT